MGLLDGDVAAAFASVFGGFYLDATLHRSSETDTDGTVSQSFTDEPVKAQLTRTTQAMRDTPGYVDTDQGIHVLAYGVNEPDADCEITVDGRRWGIRAVGRDPAGARWALHGRKA